MDIQVTQSHEVTVVALTGDLDTASAPQLKGTLEDLLARGKTRLVLDLFGVAYIDSAGLGELVRAMKRSRECAGDLRVCALRGDVLRIFEMTRLTEGMGVYPTLNEAVASWR
ncbi:MAG: Anti-sigma F factor antagonist [Candidatus Rokubacteria bacterium CSP1-6]|nr:MAG: Anti-sigma F factor antagonist [Candidatus Rokubacteria bacterium CSP1-6]